MTVERKEKWKQALRAVSPYDGRYYEIGEDLSSFFSESALQYYRFRVEAAWLAYQVLYPDLTFPEGLANSMRGGRAKDLCRKLQNLACDYSEEDALRIKELECECNHDVKAVELFLAEKVESYGFGDLRPYIHLGCTSEDITNIAYAWAITNATEHIILPELKAVLEKLSEFVEQYAGTPMLAHTHGQPATPSTFGKVMSVPYMRLIDCYLNLSSNFIAKAKFSGATGNFAAMAAAYPDKNWPEIMEDFISDDYGLLDDMEFIFNPYTDQIDPHDWLARLLNELKLTLQILRDFDTDCWLYIHKGYLGQKVVSGEVGSSTMPNKVNPITFENSEGACKVATGLINAIADELPRSRMQRDLSDSIVQRPIGLVYASALQALRQTQKGLNKIVVDEAALKDDLDTHPEVLAEAIQTRLRRRGVADAYYRLKELTRGRAVTLTMLHAFIDAQSEFTTADKEYLKALRPETYTGWSKAIAEKAIEDTKYLFAPTPY